MVNQGCGAQCRLAPEGGNHPEWPTSYPATFDLSPFGSQFLRENLAQTTGRPDDRATRLGEHRRPTTKSVLQCLHRLVGRSPWIVPKIPRTRSIITHSVKVRLLTTIDNVATRSAHHRV